MSSITHQQLPISLLNSEKFSSKIPLNVLLQESGKVSQYPSVLQSRNLVPSQDCQWITSIPLSVSP